jgi:hypothetical protein
MENLSQELVDHITSYFVRSRDLKQLLTVSKSFQSSVERRFLAKFSLNEGNTDKFLQLYTGNRIRYLRHVQFLPTFPMVDGEFNLEEGAREKPEDLLKKDRLFTRQIECLFRTLECLEDGIGAEKIAGQLCLTIFPPRRAVKYDFCVRDCVCWRVHLLHPEKLPQLSSIHNLCIKDGGYFNPLGTGHRDPEFVSHHAPSKLDLRIILDLASKFLNLKSLDCCLRSVHSGANAEEETTRHYLKDWAGPYRDTRHDFAEAVNYIKLPSSLKHINFNFHPHYNQNYPDQRERLPNLVLPCHYDPYSTSLRVLSYNLESMVLRVTVDKTLFWPTDDKSPLWPNLKYLEVMFMPSSPCGAWYFQGPQGEGSDASPGYEITHEHYEPMETNPTDRHYDARAHGGHYYTFNYTQFRVVPIEETLYPFLVSFGKAAASMPSLKKAILWAALEFNPSDAYDYYGKLLSELDEKFGKDKFRNSLGWGIAYAKPEEPMSLEGMGNGNCHSRQLWWMTGNWRPDKTLHSIFHKIGELEHGDEALDHFASDFGHKWHSRYIFRDVGFSGDPHWL